MRIRWTSRAAEQLAATLDYLANESPAAAFQVGVRISRSEALLRRYPRIGHEGFVADTRELVVANTPYLIVYASSPELITILALIDCRSDWIAKFSNNAISEPVQLSGS